MRTEQLIDLLARHAGPAPRHVVERRLGAAAGLGAVASAVGTVLLLGLNSGLADMGTALAAKLAYITALLLSAAWLADRTARPGAPWRRALWPVATVVLVMALLALTVWLQATDAQRPSLLLGHSWTACPWRVATLSLPALAATLWALRGLAPTRPRTAGFAAGLLAGCGGALGYALHCPELSPLFVLVWYTAGILMPAGLGALLGPWLLRW